MKSAVSREVRLVSRPHGWPTLESFQVVRVELPPVRDGEVLVRNLFMSVDPYMRGRMNDAPSYVPPFALDHALAGGAVGEVVESRAAGLSKGDTVLSNRGWRESFVAPLAELHKLDDPISPVSLYLGALGMPGLTAWAGLRLVDVTAKDVVYVSAAAGAVGNVAGQLAKLRGCRVIGSAGSSDKVKFLVEELGFDAAFDYKDGDLPGQLKRAAPDGIDVYFDLVGGEQLEAALSSLRLHGRIIACGAISQYIEASALPGPRNLALVIGKRLTMKGLISSDWIESVPEFRREVGAHVRDHSLKTQETVLIGIENAPRAFLDMMHGANVGKMLVELD